MKLVVSVEPTSPTDETYVFRGEFKRSEMDALRLNWLEKEVLRTTGADAEPADVLLALEILFRRHAEQSKGVAKCAIPA